MKRRGLRSMGLYLVRVGVGVEVRTRGRIKARVRVKVRARVRVGVGRASSVQRVSLDGWLLAALVPHLP